MGKMLAIIALTLLVPGAAAAQNPPEGQQTQSPGATTDAASDTAGIQLPPPVMRNIITTEKPIKGVPAGVIPRPNAATIAGNPAAPQAAQGQVPNDAGTGSASVASGQTATAGTVAAPWSGAPAGADSSALAVLPPQRTEQKPAPPVRPEKPGRPQSNTFHEELSLFNTPTANLRTMKIVIDDQYNLVGMVYGEQLGFIRILSADNNGDFTEVWKSPPLNSEVCGVFVYNLDHTGEAEIIVYTAEGNIFIYGYDTHELKYKTPDGTYQGINCMVIFNLDDSPEMELLFITKSGKMIQFDPVTKFEEWTSTETYTATDMVIGNVDNDRDPEIILNTGEVLNSRFKSVKWKMDTKFVQPNTRLYLIDMDSDGILELVVEYEQGYVRVLDVDQRQEKW